MLVLTGAQMREADKYTIEKEGVPSLTLMRRAGKALAVEAEKLSETGKILCVCGGGNNGGDGFVCAQFLKKSARGAETACFAEKLSNDCAVNKQAWEEMGGVCFTELPQKDYAVIVDCLFGTGFRGSLEGKEKAAAEWINEQRKRGAKVLSADIPSGVNGENGRVDGVAVCADVTLCIGEIKTGVLLNDGIDHAGEIKRADIGIVLPEKEYAVLTDKALVKAILPIRKRNTHKGTYGRAAIVGGGEEYTGAAYLSAAACLRSGAGYTTLFVPKTLLPIYALKSPEILLRASNEGSRYAFNVEIMKQMLDYDSIAYGMGMGVSKEVFQGVKFLLEHYEGKLILDADGLNSLAQFAGDTLGGLLKNKKCDVICTPHVKEFSRLSGLTVEEILNGSINAAKGFASSYGVSVLLKNAVSVVTDGARTAFNAAGNSGQAKGGSGDVLAGVLAGLCAIGLSAYEGGVAGAYLVGKAAELASLDFGEYSLTASELIAYLPKTFLFATKDTDENSGEQ